MPTMPKLVPFMTGRHGRLIITQDRVPKSYPANTYSLKPNVTKHNDGVNGEDRDRLDVTLNYYEGSFQMKIGDAEWLRDWLAAQKVRDAKTLPMEQQGALRFEPNDGTRKSFVLVDMVIDEFDYSSPGRSEKQTVTFNWRCTDVKEAKSR